MLDGKNFSGKRVEHYLFSSLLGSGGAGNIYRAIDTRLKNPPTCAVKCVRESRNDYKRHQQNAEARNHRAVRQCPNVMTLLDAFHDDGYIFLVLPLCETDMYRVMWNEKAYWKNEPLIRKVFVDLLDGVFACHSKGIFHRDLKPENIMCSADGTNIKIGDFGLSTSNRVKYDVCGTAPYMGPECWIEGLYYFADRVDTWSLGIILFNMVTYRYPWDEARPMTDEKYMAFLCEKDYLLRRYPISERLGALLKQILHPTPFARLLIPEIRKAILKMDTFYKPTSPSDAISPLPKVVKLVDSEKTRVASVEGDKEKGHLY